MTVAHAGEHAAGGSLGAGLVPLLVVLLAAAAYGAGLLNLRRRGIAWSAGRVVCATAGLVALGLAVASPLARAESFAAHAVQHVLLAMVTPVLLALSAPVLLSLRALTGASRRYVLAVVHSRVARVLMWAPSVLVLDVGGMYAYYLTGLFELSDRQPALHLLVHAHMLLAGCLLAWLLLGADPVPHRPSLSGSVAVLFVATAAHHVLAKLMYAHLLPSGAGPPADVRLGAQILFYGGEAVEVAMAVALMWAWYRRTGRSLARDQRRSAMPAFR